MFDLLTHETLGAEVPTPLPGRVILFANSAGTMCAKLPDGSVSVVRGEPGPAGQSNTPGPIGPQGAQGAQGAQGPQGVQGVPGPAGVVGPSVALSVGAYAILKASDNALGLVVGSAVVSNGENLSYSTTGATGSTSVPSGQLWRYMGGVYASSSAYLFQRVS